MQSLINNLRFEVSNNIIRLHWQMSARNGQLLWYHNPLVIRVCVDPFDKVTLPNPILHHMDAANYEVTHGFETSAVIVTGTRSETIRAFHPSGKYNSNADGNWYEIKIDTNHEKISKSADHIAPFLEWNITIGTDFVV